MAAIDPIKLCCFHRQSEHRGPQCPDGKVMCCLCFDRFDVADLADDSDGATIDVCRSCHTAEAIAYDRAESDTSSNARPDTAVERGNWPESSPNHPDGA